MDSAKLGPKRYLLYVIEAISGLLFAIFALDDYYVATAGIVYATQPPPAGVWLVSVAKPLMDALSLVGFGYIFRSMKLVGICGFASFGAFILAYFALQLYRGVVRAVERAFLVVAPVGLLIFEAGIVVFDMKEYNLCATLFLKEMGLGFITNSVLAMLSWVMLSVGVYVTTIMPRFRHSAEGARP